MELGDQNLSITLFEEQPIRRVWHDERWFYSIIDTVAVLVPTSSNPGRYWSDMKRRLHNNEAFKKILPHCFGLKVIAPDGKFYATDSFATDELFQIILYIPAFHRLKQERQSSNSGKSGIYAIANVTTGEQYIGSSVNITSRYQQHLSELRRGKHHSTRLQAAWNEQGEETFLLVVLEEVTDASQLAQREQDYLDHENCIYNAAQVASNVATMQPPDENKMRRLLTFLEREVNASVDAIFLQHLQFSINQGVVTPGPKYHLLLQAAKANVTTWEGFQDYVKRS